MSSQDFTCTLLTDKTAGEVFNAINNVRGWWSAEIEGPTDQLNAEFTYHYEDLHYCKLKIITLIPDKKITWLVKYNYFKFTKDKSEWTGTKICFEIAEKDNKTAVQFTHQGLLPEFECYGICSNAWSHYIQQSLRDLIITGKGRPNSKGNPSTADEKRLSTAG
ncbi:MAG: SRPBCC domain-containing protein [Sphingobacteriales bacterium]|nr:SRPBCC domain-containing protein [Sphingobacteriales bacterium]